MTCSIGGPNEFVAVAVVCVGIAMMGVPENPNRPPPGPGPECEWCPPPCMAAIVVDDDTLPPPPNKCGTT